MLDVALLIQVGFVLCITELRLLFCVGGIVSAVHADVTGFDFNDLGYNFIEKITVMGNDEYSARIIQKISFQPGDAFHIEVVGRLIEKQDIRFGNQQFTECDTCFLTTGKSGNLFVEIFFSETKTIQNTHQLTLVCITVFKLKFVCQTRVAVHQTIQFFAGSVFHLKLHGTHALFHVNDVLFGAEQLFVNGAVSLYILILCEITDLPVFHQDDLTGISMQFVHDDTEKCGFACAIVTDQSGFFAFFYMK